jgi:hypothetical protein
MAILSPHGNDVHLKTEKEPLRQTVVHDVCTTLEEPKDVLVNKETTKNATMTKQQTSVISESNSERDMEWKRDSSANAGGEEPKSPAKPRSQLENKNVGKDGDFGAPPPAWALELMDALKADFDNRNFTLASEDFVSPLLSGEDNFKTETMIPVSPTSTTNHQTSIMSESNSECNTEWKRDSNAHAGGKEPKSRVKGCRLGNKNLGEEAKEVLTRWMFAPEHVKHPYPNNEVRTRMRERLFVLVLFFFTRVCCLTLALLIGELACAKGGSYRDLSRTRCLFIYNCESSPDLHRKRRCLLAKQAWR